MGVTNRGKLRLLSIALRNETTNLDAFNLALVTSAVAPTVDTNVFSELTEIAAGNGYTSGGLAVARNATDWDTVAEDDTGDKATFKLKDMTWTATGGPLPASGAGARYAVLLDNNVTVASREVLAWWDLVSDRSVSVGQPLSLVDTELDATEPLA